MTAEIVQIEATPDGAIIEVLRVVNPKDAFEPVKTPVVEWLDERHFRDVVVSGDPLDTTFGSASGEL